MLSEQGQIQAAKEIASTYLKKWPALGKVGKAPGKEVLIVLLGETQGLLAALGDAPGVVQVCGTFELN
jgi:hypothetical protein